MVTGLPAAAFAFLVALGAGSSYGTLLPGLLLGCGLDMPPRPWTPDRSGTAPAVSDTARQAGGAVGIATVEAVAAPASNARSFVSGMHVSGLVPVVLFLVTALSTVLLGAN